MKQYFAYGAFTVCLTNAIVRPDLFSVILVGITCVMALTAFTHATSVFEDTVDQELKKLKDYVQKELQFYSTDINNIRSANEALHSRNGELENHIATVTKEISETKRVVRDINLANTFVPRAKRNSGAEL
jgi:peptidoglycan hydrolase CwlO-like protein